MKKLLVILFVLGLSSSARAESIGLGVFLGQPTGLDIKIGLQGRSAIDIVLGANRFDEPRVSYGHVQYLALLGVAHGQSVNVPFRLGVGGAVFALTEDNTTLAARVPLQIGLRFRRTPLEIYGEVAFVILFNDGTDTDIDGGLGLRVYF
jgi:hypothetical protein